MGGLIGLCSPDGGPCGGGAEAVDDEQRPLRTTDPKRRGNDSETSSETPESSIEKGSIANRKYSFESKINLAERRILCPPLIAKHILSNETFMEIREQMEQKAIEKYKSDIDQINYSADNNGGSWLIKGKDSISLEEHINLFDVIIWRVPTIPAFAHVQNAQELYQMLNNQKEIINLDQITEGIWGILSKETFIKTFERDLLTEIDIINDENHYYLKDEEDYELIKAKLNKISVMKKSNEIIIIGQKKCAENVIKTIRMREVEHSSMKGMLESIRQTSYGWEVKSDDDQVPDPKVITSNYCIISNVPLNATQESIENVLSNYQRWTYATVMEHDNDEKDNIADNDSDDDENENEKIKKPSLEYQFAKIEFDDPHSLQIFVDHLEKNQIIVGYNTVSLLRHDTEERKRKRRRLYAGHMIV